jgi:(2Fe-2S) ferredoxin
VYQAFVDELEQRGLKDAIRLTHSGCLGPCQGGPSVLVYPEGVLYGQVHPDDVSAIVQQHLLDGQPLARLALQQW